MKTLLEIIQTSIVDEREITSITNSQDITDLLGAARTSKINSVKKNNPGATIRLHYHRHDEGGLCTTELV